MFHLAVPRHHDYPPEFNWLQSQSLRAVAQLIESAVRYVVAAQDPESAADFLDSLYHLTIRHIRSLPHPWNQHNPAEEDQDQ